jgi:hypothetical protein
MNNSDRSDRGSSRSTGIHGRYQPTASADSWRVIICCDDSRRFDPKVAAALQTTIGLANRQAYRLTIGIARSSGELCLADGMTQKQAVRVVEALAVGQFGIRCEAAEHAPSMKVATPPTLIGTLRLGWSGSPDTSWR